jgi:hypothetical protein
MNGCVFLARSDESVKIARTELVPGLTSHCEVLRAHILEDKDDFAVGSGWFELMS